MCQAKAKFTAEKSRQTEGVEKRGGSSMVGKKPTRFSLKLTPNLDDLRK